MIPQWGLLTEITDGLCHTTTVTPPHPSPQALVKTTTEISVLTACALTASLEVPKEQMREPWFKTTLGHVSREPLPRDT